MQTPPITGQVIFREAGEKDGRQLFMICGILAVPHGQEWQGEHQYTVYGWKNQHLMLDLESPIDRTETIHGIGIGSTLLQPIWRI